MLEGGALRGARLCVRVLGVGLLVGGGILRNSGRGGGARCACASPHLHLPSPSPPHELRTFEWSQNIGLTIGAKAGSQKGLAGAAAAAAFDAGTGSAARAAPTSARAAINRIALLRSIVPV